MSASAWIMLTLTWGAVTAITGYLFWKVLRTPPRE